MRPSPPTSLRRSAGTPLLLVLAVVLLGAAAPPVLSGERAEDATGAVAQRAFDAFRRDIETGEVEPFLALLADDVSFTVPMPLARFRGEQVGKEAYRAISRWRYSDVGMRSTISNVVMVGSGERVGFQYEISGRAQGKPYRNWLAAFFEVRDGKVVRFREYAGDLDPEAISQAAGNTSP